MANNLGTNRLIGCLRFLTLMLGLSWSMVVKAEGENIPDKPNPPRLYNDLTAEGNFLTSDKAMLMESKLVLFDDSTSNQIAVVIIDDLKGMPAWQYAMELGHKWGVGRKEKDNGVVLLVNTGKVDGNKKVSIMAGYGLEAVITDATAQHIIDELIIPNLKSGDYYQALDLATTRLMLLAKGEYHDPIKRKSAKKGWSIFAIILIFLVIYLISRGGGGGMTIGPRGTIFGGYGRWGGGSWSGGSSWGGGSSGGGGFGGFGGGGFGGGGASGSW